MKAFLLFLIAPIFCLSQKVKQSQIKEDSVIKKWTTAIINVETKPSYQKQINKIDSLFETSEITFQEKRLREDSFYNYPLGNVRFNGTAIFVKNKNDFYLLTAKHVVRDTTSDLLDGGFRNLVVVENVTGKQNHIKPMTVDSHGNVFAEDNSTLSLRLDSHNHPELNSFAVSSDSDDLAIVAIGGCPDGKEFVKGLFDAGYIPILLSQIDTVCKIVDNESIYAFGFPKESYIINKKLPRALFNWESNSESLPFVSKGVTVRSLIKSHTFEGAIFTYHGNSGGPIVRNNKLIGIVSGFNVDTFNVMNTGRLLSGYEYYHSRFIKTSLVMQLVRNIELFGLNLNYDQRLQLYINKRY